MHIYKRALAIILFCAGLAGCRKEEMLPVTPDFTYQLTDTSRTVPVNVRFTNTSRGANSFKWTFEGGEPASSTKADPGVVAFSTAGEHRVTLEAWNEDMRESKTTIINLDSAVIADFDTTVVLNSLSPLTVKITNRTTGASSFDWTFEGGSPAAFSGPTPPDVTFTDPGEHRITLRAGNGSSYFTRTKKITVGPLLEAAFRIQPSFEDEDYEAPLQATLANTTAGSISWQWSATGGILSATNTPQPTIYFPTAGTYTVTLTAGNGKSMQTVTQTITVKPNTNLRTHSGIRLGIAAAHGGVGSFYSTALRKVFTGADNLDTAGKWIDLAFFGLNQQFAFNKFISPDSAAAYALPAIPGATKTVYINSQEHCACGAGLTAADFDAMTTDAPLQTLPISPSTAGAHQFTNAIANRVVLFRTADGRKGAIKIRQFVPAGSSSYILVDIKVQKND